MGQSTRLRLRDVNLAYQIVGECRELWADPAAWRQHLVEGASRLTGMAVAHYAEISSSLIGARARIFVTAHVGWRDASARSAYDTAKIANPDTLVFFLGFDRFVPRLLAGKAVVAMRSEMCRDDVWYRSSVLNEFRRPACIDDNVISVRRLAPGIVGELDVNQDVADARPTVRTKRQLGLLHRLIHGLIGTELATEHQRGLHGLTPQLRATLERLLAGESEKHIAARLGIRPVTVHEYVGKVYRHFGVRSRAELMAYFVRRRPTPR